MSDTPTYRIADLLLIGSFSCSVILLALVIGRILPVAPKAEIMQSQPEEVVFVGHTPLVARPYRAYVSKGKKFPNEITDVLDGVSDADTLKFSCGEEFVNTGDGYYYREYGTHETERKVDDTLLLDAIAQAHEQRSAGRDILGGQLCAAESGTMLFQYTEGIGAYPYGISPDATTYLVAHDGRTWIEKTAVANHHRWPAPGCQVPLLVTQEGTVYMVCGEIDGSGGGAMTYYSVDTRSARAKEVTVCTYSYEGGVRYTCT